ncbi:MAG: lysophospholipid acyltransferase family protein [Bacillota bacterium]
MLYRVAWILCRTYLLVIRRISISGTEHVPRQGGLILVSNHVSYLDPVAIASSLPQSRHVYFMAKYELFKIPLLGFIITRLGAFSVKRGGADRSAIRTALSHLDNGRVVGIFPEGTRNTTKEEMLEPHMGAAMLSLKAGVPVLPVAVTGSRGFFRKVSVRFGEPMYFNSDPAGKKAGRKELVDISTKIMAKVAGLMDTKSGDII